MRAGLRWVCVAGSCFAALIGAQARASQAPNAVQSVLPTFHLVEEMRTDPREGLNADFAAFLLVNPRGRIVFGEPRALRVRFYDANGKRIGEFGKCGDGPGAFSARQLRMGLTADFRGGTLADSVWFYDEYSRRITFVTSQGDFLRTMETSDQAYGPVPSACGGTQWLRSVSQIPAALSARAVSPRATRPDDDDPRQSTSYAPLAAYGDGSVLWRTVFETSVQLASYDGRTGWSGRTDSVRFVRGSEAGDSSRAVASMPTNPARVIVNGVAHIAPFGEDTEVAVAQDGNRIAFLTPHATSSAGGTVALTMVTAKGDTIFTRSYPVKGRPVDRNSADALAAQIARNANDGIARLDSKQADEYRRKLSAGVPPSTLHAGVTIGIDNSIWLALRGGPGAETPASGADPGLYARSRSTTWLILDDRGQPIGTLPYRPPYVSFDARLLRMTRDHLWTVEGKDGGLSIVRYRLEPDVPSNPRSGMEGTHQ